MRHAKPLVLGKFVSLGSIKTIKSSHSTDQQHTYNHIHLLPPSLHPPSIARMASTAAMRPLGFAPSLVSRSIARRTFTTLNSTRPRGAPRPDFNKPILRQQFRRAQSTEAPLPKKRGAFRSLLRWTWRLTYLSAIGGAAYIGYGIWELRHPVEQEEPGADKKTLVILGMSNAFSH